MALALALAAALSAAGDSKYLRRDLDGVRADYLIVAPPEFAEACDALAEHRARGGGAAAVVRTDDVAARFGPGADGLARFVARVRPRFLLLAGDADRVPTFERPSAYRSDRFPCDPDLATDHLFGPVAGRLPADTREELGAMIAKTLAYEREPAGGPWQKKVTVLAGEGGFGPLLDLALEAQFSAVVARGIPPEYDVETAYAKLSSKYGYYPPRFNDHAVRLLNEGSLFYAYVGHGLRTGFDEVRYNGFLYPVLESRDAARVEVRAGLPVMVVLACLTGAYDARFGDSIGEELLKRPRGPVAFIGGSRITQPYGNALLGEALVAEVFRPGGAPTLGEALWAAKAAVLNDGPRTPLRLRADALAGLVQGPASLEPMRRDVTLHYNLLGDPALRLRRPGRDLELSAPERVPPGATLSVSGRLPEEGPVEVTFECPRDRFYHPTDLVGETVEAQIVRRYANANNKVIVRGRAESRGGAFALELSLPADLVPGDYFLKAWGAGRAAARAIEVRRPEPPTTER
jgi:hypothetical protein